jgi:hypothetical protein
MSTRYRDKLVRQICIFQQHLLLQMFDLLRNEKEYDSQFLTII